LSPFKCSTTVAVTLAPLTIGLPIVVLPPFEVKSTLSKLTESPSPAEEADIQEGDKLVRMGWLSTKSFTLDKIYKKFQKKEGTKIKLTLERDGHFIQRTIVLRDFFKNY